MVVKRRAAKLAFSAAMFAAVVVGMAGSAYADDMPIPTKAPPLPPPASGSCASWWDFFTTACKLTPYYGVTVYGTIDVGGTYQTHGTPFDPNFPTGASYLIGGGGTNATNRTPGFGLAPNGLSQSLVGIKWSEPVAAGWSWVGVGELAFDPYSGLLSNAPQAMQNAKFTAQDLEELPIDSSRWGWLAGQIYTGFSSPTWGTLTFGRQNSLLNDAIVAYDPMGASYAFSPIGFSGKAAGAGDTEDARWTTAIKYRVNIGDARLALMAQPFTGHEAYEAYNPNTGAVAGGIGGDVKGLGPGVLSVDVFGTWEQDAVNIATSYTGGTLPNGYPAAPDVVNSYLKATISNQTSIMAVAKYSFGSWANPPPPVVSKAPAPSGPTGIPLTLYAGYEYVVFANPSDPQISFPDDGFLFFDPKALTVYHGQTPSFNDTTINNNGYNINCGTGGGCKEETLQFVWVGAKYGITKDLDIIGAYYEYIQNMYTLDAGNACAIAAGHSQCAGNLFVWSAVLDWRFLPKWDAYVGTMYSVADGGIANGDITRNNLATTAGVRFRF